MGDYKFQDNNSKTSYSTYLYISLAIILTIAGGYYVYYYTDLFSNAPMDKANRDIAQLKRDVLIINEDIIRINNKIDPVTQVT